MNEDNIKNIDDIENEYDDVENEKHESEVVENNSENDLEDDEDLEKSKEDAKKDKELLENHVDHVLPINLSNCMQDSFLSYAMSVIVARALPDVRDGLKPVQRRIL